ncbi:MAG: ATP-binding protein [Bacteroidota bacterium]
MAIRDLSELAFVDELQHYLTPSSPIQRLQLLKGREEQVKQITRAFHSKGRHVFIHGDRGVGKSSLALSVANYLSEEDVRPVQLACNGESFFSIMQEFASQLLNSSPFMGVLETKGRIGFSASGLSAALEAKLNKKEVPPLSSLNEVMSVIGYCARQSNGERVVVFDEFDALPSDSDRKHFADFIKQMGDQTVPMKMIFTGIGQSLESLLAAHHSCYRYLAAVGLTPLDWNGRLDIINAAAEALEIEVDLSTQYRIGSISDGFPITSTSSVRSCFGLSLTMRTSLPKLILVTTNRQSKTLFEISSRRFRNSMRMLQGNTTTTTRRFFGQSQITTSLNDGAPTSFSLIKRS